MNQIKSYMNEFSAVRHEGVNGCKFKGVSCETYIEIANDAFIKYYQDSFLELRNVVLLSPLILKIDDPQEIRTIIKKESDHLKFIISSREKQEGEEKCRQWIRHAEGSMYTFGEDEATGYTLQELKERCERVKKTIKINVVTGISGPGAVWDYIAHLCLGEGEALIKFEIPDEEVMEALKGYILHSCIIDCIVDTAVRYLAGDGWKAISYESIKFYGTISDKTYAYIWTNNNEKNNIKEKGFHLTLFSESGNRFAEIKNYKIRYGKADDDQSKSYQNIRYSTAKHGRPVEDISKENNASLFISGLSWRQMNCRDRIIAFLLGHKNDVLINYMKFFIGTKRGYKLKKSGFIKPGDWIEDIFHNRILNQFGYSVNIIKVDNVKEVHERISDFIDKGKPVGFWMDEYHIFYTPFYHKSHTGHIAALNGYNKDSKLYAIIDHNHLRINSPSQFIDYGQFYCTYETLNNIYTGMESKNRFIITLDDVADGKSPGFKELHQQFISILSYLADSEQAGNDTLTIYKSISREGSFDVDNVDDLYIQLGGKELLIDTIMNYLYPKHEKIDLIKELSYKIIQNSNMLVNSYITSLYRGKGISRDKAEDQIQVIQKDSVQLFREILKQYT